MAATFVLSEHFINAKPEIFILVQGSNNIVAGHQPLVIARDLIKLADPLLICSIIPRHANIVDVVDFSSTSHDTNNILRNTYGVEPEKTYHLHKGFWTTHYANWSKDAYTQTYRQAERSIMPLSKQVSSLPYRP